MTARLPTPGGDSGNWGAILNDYLSVSLASDGTLNTGVVGTAQLANNAITTAQLDSPTQTTLAAVAGKAPLASPTFTGSVTLPGDPTTSLQAATKNYVDSTTVAGAPNASTTTKGIATLSVAPVSSTSPIAVGDNDTRMTNARTPTGTITGGDLSGSYPSPTLIATGPGATGPIGGATQTPVITIDAKGRVTALASATIAAGVTLDSTLADIQPDTITGSAVIGSTGKAADAGHQHALVTHDHTTTSKGGQIPVGGLSATGTASSSTFLRGDNTWTTPATGGDASTNTSTSVDGEVALFSGTGGKTLKRAAGSGIAKLTSGILSTGTAGTDYAPGTASNATGIVKSTTGTGALTTAIAADFPTLNQPTTGKSGSTDALNTTGAAVNVAGSSAPTGSGQTLVSTDATHATWQTVSSGGSPITTQNQGTTLTANTAQLNFTGSGVTASNSGANVTVTIPGGGSGGTPLLAPTANKTSAYTAVANVDYVLVDTTSAAVTVTLPTAPADKARIGVKLVIQGSTNVVTVACGGSDHINLPTGPTSGTIQLLNQAVIYQYETSTAAWVVTSDDLPLSQLDLRYIRGNGTAMVVSGTPGNGQVLTALSATTGNWQTPSGGSGGTTITSNPQTGSYTLVLGDAGKSIDVNSVSRSFSDAVLNGTTTMTSATAAFVAGDVGRLASSSLLTGGTTIVTVNSSTSVILSAAATGSGTAQSVTLGSGVPVTIPVSSNVAFPIGTVIEFCQTGPGQITITAFAGVTINSPGGRVHTNVQYSSLSARQTATDVWLLSGDLA